MSANKCFYSDKFMPLVTSWVNDVAKGIKTQEEFLQFLTDNFEDNSVELFNTILGHYPVD